MGLVVVNCAFGLVGGIRGAESQLPFGGEKTAWHGFDRYDFVMDAALSITPIKAAEDEKDGIKHTVDGQWRCIVIVPKTAAGGNPWAWRGCYWDHQPQSEVEPRDPKLVVDFLTSSFPKGNPGLSKLPPLVDLGPGQTYNGQEGGLYPGGSNVRPAAHDAAGKKIAQGIAPLDADGNSDPVNGKIVIMPVSVSNGYGAWHRGDESDTSTTFMTRANASAAANPVSGATTTLSVEGADDGGEPRLTYTWSCSGPADVTFSVNGPNKAKNTTVTFSCAGRYTFQATVGDYAGLTATSSTVVTVTGP